MHNYTNLKAWPLSPHLLTKTRNLLPESSHRFWTHIKLLCKFLPFWSIWKPKKNPTRWWAGTRQTSHLNWEKLADWYQLTIWSNTLPKNICFTNNPFSLPGTNAVFKRIHWAAKQLEIKVKLNTFSCFFCQESHHHDLNIFIPFFFALPLLRFILEHIWIIRRKKGENYINSTYFQEIPQNLMVLASYYSISHMKLYTLDLPKINPRSSTVD